MTIEKALKVINSDLINYQEMLDARIVLSEAYKKHIPKKVKKEHIETYLCALTLEICPTCDVSYGGRASVQNYNYCPYCGQALDWSDNK